MGHYGSCLGVEAMFVKLVQQVGARLLLGSAAAAITMATVQTKATAQISVTTQMSSVEITLEATEADSQTTTGVIDEVEIPEEILRTEIITEARSPLTGQPLSAAEYARLQAELASPSGNTLLSQDIRYLIFLLQIRRAYQPLLPFGR